MVNQNSNIFYEGFFFFFFQTYMFTEDSELLSQYSSYFIYKGRNRKTAIGTDLPVSHKTTE